MLLSYVEAPSATVFTIFYAVFCAGFLLQFREFVGVGLSTENLLSSLIACSEEVTLIEFHLRKTAFTLVVHSLLPLGNYKFNFPYEIPIFTYK